LEFAQTGDTMTFKTSICQVGFRFNITRHKMISMILTTSIELCWRKENKNR
jgi:hypothetical protein